jgi:hypothetical protein
MTSLAHDLANNGSISHFARRLQVAFAHCAQASAGAAFFALHREDVVRIGIDETGSGME